MKLCDTCIYRNNVEQLKPCIIYRDNCEYYEKERGDMSGDLISRQEVLDGIEELKKSPWATDKRGNGFEYLITEALDVVAHLCVEQAPSVNPQEPKTGHWIIYNYPGRECVYCSSCKEEYYEDDLYLGGSEFPNYCPNCGARMESEGEDISSCNITKTLQDVAKIVN